MWLKSISISNIKSIGSHEPIQLSRGINLFTGPNNAGKSIILQVAHKLQTTGAELLPIRKRATACSTSITVEDISIDNMMFDGITGGLSPESYPLSAIASFKRSSVDSSEQTNLIIDKRVLRLPLIGDKTDQNFIDLFLAKRKTAAYQEVINDANVKTVKNDLSLLYPRIDNIVGDRHHPDHEEFVEITNEILGFPISSITSEKGKKTALRIDKHDHIYISEMGEGVPQILGLLVDLCQAENKLFLIEEMENDIHPAALKKLLKLILKKSKNNQFLITTHDNVILRHLGAEEGSKVFGVRMNLDEQKIPKTKIDELKTQDERQAVLEELGYELFDVGLWKGWLILEESSAERIIRDYLIKWFTPKLLGRLRTIATKGASELEPRFIDFERLFTFVHLESIYKDKAWVIADGDKAGQEAIKQIKENYSSWGDSHFQNFIQTDFENYYPECFKDKVKEVLSISKKKEKRGKKKELLDDVLDYIEKDEDKAKEAFKESAEEVITILKSIEDEIG